MTNWRVTSHYYLEAESEAEAWSMATLELPNNSQITTLEGEGEGECDKCANSYELSSRDNRCGDCGNCNTCCTHEREGK